MYAQILIIINGIFSESDLVEPPIHLHHSLVVIKWIQNDFSRGHVYVAIASNLRSH